MRNGDCCNPRHPLNRDGTSQAQRASAMLEPSSVQLDDRSLAHLLAWARGYGRELVFYNALNKVSGDWESLMSNDPSTLVALVSLYDQKAFLAGFNRLEAEVGALDGKPGRRGALRTLCQYMVGLARLFDDWYAKAPADLLIARELDTAIRADLAPALQRLRAYDLGAHAGLGGANAGPLGLDYGTLLDSALWGLGAVAASDRIYVGADTDARITHATARLSALFGRMHRVLVRTVGLAPRLMADSLDWPYHQPHMALFIAFLKLFGLAQDTLNDLTRRHLLHYYQQVLRLGRKAAVPDRAHLVFTPAAKQKAPFLLAAGAEFKAGKDSAGKELRYGLGADAAVNTATVADVRALYLREAEGETRLYLSPVANSADGQGGAFANPGEIQWKSFGQDTGRPLATLGLVVASPSLRLAEGIRTVVLTLTFAAETMPAANDGGALFSLSLSTNKGWYDVPTPTVTIDEDAKTLTLTLNLGPEAPPVAAFVPGSGQVPDGVSVPMLRILANGAQAPRYHRFLTGAPVAAISLDVDVTALRSVVLANNVGPLAADKPFAPFGQQPAKGAVLYVGSWEAMQKQLTELSLDIVWDSVPDFDDHYAGYNRNLDADANNDDPPVFSIPDNEETRCTVHLLDRGRQSLELVPPAAPTADPWVPVDVLENRLFPLEADDKCTLAITMPPRWRRDNALAPFDTFDPGAPRGFVRVTLTGDLLHSAYTIAYTLAAIAIAKGQAATLPKPPYLPVAKSLTLNYHARDDWDLTTLHEADAVEALFHLCPFGVRQAGGDALTLLPALDLGTPADAGGERRAGHLYIGLQGAPESDLSYALSVLFQVAEGTENPRLTPPAVHWAYLAGDAWVALEPGATVADGTRGLTQSGIVGFTIGPDAGAAHSLLPAGLLWLRATVLTDPDGLSELIALHAQAAEVVFRDAGNAPDHLSVALAAGSIAKMVDKDARLAAVEQPYASFGGSMAEADTAFYTRASERLRHKARAIGIWDYERLVLDHFPEIYKVKCLSHATDTRELAPGHVAVVVIPNVRNKNGFDRLEPYASQALRGRIADMLAARLPLSAQAGLSVLPPVYERLTTRFSVAYAATVADATLASRQLRRDIVHFLCPWAYEDGRDISFGGRIPASALIDFIDELPYVDSVHDFALLQDGIPVSEAVAHTARSVLVAAPEGDHVITERTERGRGQ